MESSCKLSNYVNGSSTKDKYTDVKLDAEVRAANIDIFQGATSFNRR